jgi:ABC-type nitrate/sulfonate/bicarbonate transport system substrate-binding protein
MARRALVLTCLFLSLAVREVRPQSTLQKVKVAVSSRGIAFIDLYIAQDRGFFREEGLEAELVQVSANVATALSKTMSRFASDRLDRQTTPRAGVVYEAVLGSKKS